MSSRRAGLPFLLTGLILASALAGGCRLWPREDIITEEAQENIREVESRSKEDRTLSGLAKIEEGISSYYNVEKKIPKTLEALVPKYVAEIPVVEIGNRHRETTRVQNYPPDILRDGQIDGSRLKDTGRWGYVYTDRQIVVFVDCTHKNGKGKPWYGQRGYH